MTAIRKWEYLFQVIDQSQWDMSRELNRLGEAGWEAFAVHRNANGYSYDLFCKRDLGWQEVNDE